MSNPLPTKFRLRKMFPNELQLKKAKKSAKNLKLLQHNLFKTDIFKRINSYANIAILTLTKKTHKQTEKKCL